MAFWQRKDGRRVFVYFWCKSTGKQKLVPRSETHHLDGRSDAAIDEWVRVWQGSTQFLKKEIKPVVRNDLKSLVQQFADHQKEDFKRHPYTIQPHVRNLIYFALPYFFHELGLNELSEIRAHSVKMNHYLRDKLELTASKIRYIQMSLRMFWRWLEEEGKVEGRLVLRRTVLPSRSTPLLQTPNPNQILAWSTDREDIRLLLLLAYFFSLRPQEILALKPSDFMAGDYAAKQEACRVMRQTNLFDRLIVRIRFQRSRKIGLTTPKAGSLGFVACFDKRGAQAIVEILRTKPRDEFLFPFGNDWYYKYWRRNGYPNLTMKDCRRASLYWLGHYSDLDIVALRNHARHADIKTTSLYTRRPLYDSLPEDGSWDLT